MGIGGHMLGARKLRKLQRKTGIPFERAYNRTGSGEGRVTVNGKCLHYQIEFAYDRYRLRLIEKPWHWSSCQNKD